MRQHRLIGPTIIFALGMTLFFLNLLLSPSADPPMRNSSFTGAGPWGATVNQEFPPHLYQILTEQGASIDDGLVGSYAGLTWGSWVATGTVPIARLYGIGDDEVYALDIDRPGAPFILGKHSIHSTWGETVTGFGRDVHGHFWAIGETPYGSHLYSLDIAASGVVSCRQIGPIGSYTRYAAFTVAAVVSGDYPEQGWAYAREREGGAPVFLRIDLATGQVLESSREDLPNWTALGRGSQGNPVGVVTDAEGLPWFAYCGTGSIGALGNVWLSQKLDRILTSVVCVPER